MTRRNLEYHQWRIVRYWPKDAFASNLSQLGAQFAVIQAFAPSLGLEVSTINVVDAPEIDRAVMGFAREPNGGLIVTANPSTVVHRQLIIALAARHKLPAVYFDRAPVETLIWLCNSDKRPAM